MQGGNAEAAVSAFRSAFIVELANTPDLIHEAFRLRHQVYCLERGYEPDTGGLETDAFDAHARHVVICARRTGEVVGTLRLILPGLGSARRLPIEHVCGPHLLTGLLPRATTAEVSRFAVSKARRDWDLQGASLLRLGLVQGAVRLSSELGLTHWCAVMERSLLRLMRSTAVHFSPIGPSIEYHGLRQPAYADIASVLLRMKREQTALWDLVTENGRFWEDASSSLIAA